MKTLELYEQYLLAHDVDHEWDEDSLYVHIPLTVGFPSDIVVECFEEDKEIYAFDNCAVDSLEVAARIARMMKKAHKKYKFDVLETESGAEIFVRKYFHYTTIDALHQHVLELADLLTQVCLMEVVG